MQRSQDIENILIELARRGETLSIAESCTGGLLSSAFTDIAGASRVFQGGIVAYQDAIKIKHLGVQASLIEQHSAVSAPVAAAMALNVAQIFQTDWSLATTGFLCPNPSLPEDQLGTVFLSGLTPKGLWTVKTIITEDRIAAKKAIVAQAIQILAEKIFS